VFTGIWSISFSLSHWLSSCSSIDLFQVVSVFGQSGQNYWLQKMPCGQSRMAFG
jgi:hypothetical protein